MDQSQALAPVDSTFCPFALYLCQTPPSGRNLGRNLGPASGRVQGRAVVVSL